MFCIFQPLAKSRVHHGLNGMHAVLGLLEHARLRALKDLIRDLHLGHAELLGDLGSDGSLRIVEARQAVHKDAPGFALAITSGVTR